MKFIILAALLSALFLVNRAGAADVQEEPKQVEMQLTNSGRTVNQEQGEELNLEAARAPQEVPLESQTVKEQAFQLDSE